MNVLLIGSGGREHALAWKLAQSPKLTKLHAAPGNAGIAQCAEIAALDVGEHGAVIDFCTANNIGLVVVGPEQPLVDGLADSLRARAIPVFGPAAAAARLEGSKGFTKDLCSKANIPTAAYGRFHSAEDAGRFLDGRAPPYVIKADGLAAGKGVVIAETRADADAAILDMLGGRFGEAGEELVIEEFLEGEEASFFALADGKTVLPLAGAQDHKRAFDGDTGPNTGGMGAYSPAPALTADLERRVMAEIVEPTVDALAAEGVRYVGVLYAGLMLTKDGPKLIEYNVRFGDPECQALMVRLDSDLLALLHAAAAGRLDEAAPRWSKDTALTVVMAAKGYPGAPKKGGEIGNLESAENDDVIIFHAGTKRDEGGRLIANGGRVLNVTARGPTVRDAAQRAYEACEKIAWADGFYRRDIGRSAMGEKAGEKT